MGSKNCPETPRQRMIGMMYLVLTAMLALNVSADVLEAFTKMQESLESSIISSQRKNSDIYNEIEMAYNLNEAKVGEVRGKALIIKNKTAELLHFIDSLKHRLVQIADGPEGNVSNIQAKDNLDIGGQVMIIEGQGKALRAKIDEYRALLLSNVDAKDSILLATVNNSLNTEDPPVKDGGFKSWESSKFENIPLVGVVTMLTMYQGNILHSESDVVRYMISEIDAESFKFNKLEALIIPNSTYILNGDKLEAKIMLAAMDTTQKPEIIVNGRKIRYEGDFGVYTEVTNKVGIHKLKGVINYLSPSGQTLPRAFEMEYEVASPTVVISPTKMNVFYLGVDNPISLAVPGMSAEAISPEITNGEIIKTGNDYLVRPKQAGKNCDIHVYAMVNKQKKLLQTQSFRVKVVPDPVAKVATYREGSIRKNVLLAAGGINVELENFDFDMKFKVESFNMFTLVDGFEQSESTNGANYSADQEKMIRNLRRNQLLVIDKIMVKGPDGSTRKLASMTFKID